MAGQYSAGETKLVSRSLFGEAFSKALRLYVGRGCRYSVKQLSNATGVKDRVIECAIAGPDNSDYRSPNGEDQASLTKFLGDEFATAWMSQAIGMGAFWLPDSGHIPPPELAAVLSEDTAKIVRMAIDGKFDREETPHLHDIGRRMMVLGALLSRL